MNPNYPSNPYPYYQGNTGPPPPQWQTPQPPAPAPAPAPYRKGWHDPRPQTPSPSAYQTQAQSASYHPQTYGPVAPSQYGPNTVHGQQQPQYQIPHFDADTASWGVNHNQQPQHAHQPGPPLPPRPPSTNPVPVDHPARPAQSTTPLSSQERPNQPQLDKPVSPPSRQSWRESFYNQALAEDPVPGPPPPPIPAEYKTHSPRPSSHASSERPHDQYFTRTPSHKYEPTTRQQPSGEAKKHRWKTPQQEDPGFVSPEDKQHKRWDSSVSGGPLTQQPWGSEQEHYQSQQNPSYYRPPFPQVQSQLHATVSQGFAAPSDWERFTPVDGSNAGPGLPPELATISPVNAHQGQVPFGHEYTEASGRPINGQFVPKPQNVMQQSSSSPPAPGRGGVESTQLGPIINELPSESSPRANGDRVSSPHGSVSSNSGGSISQRSGTIDSVIDAWNTPLSQQITPLAKSSIPQRNSEGRPVSPPSQKQSPERLPKSPQASLTSVRRLSQEVFSSRTAPDPYEGVDPEYHASLTRFLKMLKQEASAQSGKEKYNIFQTFMRKENAVRVALYEIEPEGSVSVSVPQMNKFPTMSTVEEVDVVNSVSDRSLPRTASQIKRKALGPSPIEQPERAKSKVTPVLPPPTAEKSQITKSPAQEHTSPENPKTAASNSLVQSTIPSSTVNLNSEKGQHPGKLLKILTTPTTDSAAPLSTNQDSENTEKESMAAPPGQTPPQGPGNPPTSSTANSLKNTSTPPTESKAPSSNVGSRGDEDVAYSPGGRPLLFQAKSPAAQRSPPQSREPRRFPVAPAEASSPSSNAPMVIEDYEVHGGIPQVSSMPLTPNSPSRTPKSGRNPGRPLSVLSGPVKFEPPRPVYTPFRYNEAAAQNVQNILPDRPADEAYSTLRHQAAESGRLLAQDVPPSQVGGLPSIASPSNARREHQETFLGLIRRQSTAMHKAPPGPRRQPAHLRVGTPLQAVRENPTIEALSALRSVLPGSLPQDGQSHEKIIELNKTIESIPDDFGFIKESVFQWDNVNREVRNAQDEDREKRQADSEAHIDELFNANEISYADIHNIEEDFKLAEAERKYEEDQQELKSFVDSVYTPIHDRVQDEILRLTPSYTLAIDLLDLQSDASSRILSTKASRVSMAAIMYVVLHVFQKLEIRYRKLAEARFERERRRKTLELAVLFTNGNTAGIKRLEQDFTAAEKLQVLDEAHEKDKRANNLMDTFDRATARGLGDNQRYFDEILSKIQRLKEAIAKEGRQSDGTQPSAEGIREALASAQETLDFVLADSRTILTTSNAADNILNDADYQVSVSKARVSNADEMMFQKLQEDRSKEDAKITQELGSRMDGMSKSPAEATILIQEILAKTSEDPDHQDRIKRALEEAKKRNAAK